MKDSELAKVNAAQVKVMILARRLCEGMPPHSVIAAVSMALGALLEAFKSEEAKRESLITSAIEAINIGADEYLQFEADEAKAKGTQQ